MLHFAGDSTITKVVVDGDDDGADDEIGFIRLDIMLRVACCILYELLVMLYGIELNVYVFILILILILIISILNRINIRCRRGDGAKLRELST